MYLFRLLVSIALVAGVPELAKRVGPRFAGIVLLIPIISITVLYLTAQTISSSAAHKVSNAALLGLIPLALFFITVNLTLHRMHLVAALVTASLVWATVASALVLIGNPH